MGTLTKGSIVLFPFPYTDLTQRKIRPCLVLSDEMGEDILLCQITSRQIKKDQHVVALEEGVLMVPSYIRSNMLFTAAKKSLIKSVGTLPKKKYGEVVTKITRLIT